MRPEEAALLVDIQGVQRGAQLPRCRQQQAARGFQDAGVLRQADVGEEAGLGHH